MNGLVKGTNKYDSMFGYLWVGGISFFVDFLGVFCVGCWE